MMLVVVFSLSPCSLKRDVLNIFDIQHISGLNKVKITAGPASTCELSTETSSSKAAFAKADRKIKDKSFFLNSASNSGFGEKKIILNAYSGETSGNSPPKYILFKRLKLHLV
ncbi:hypothetical protein CLU96_3778 [Chryseobacterium sp. 52]|nr:hypothetical protein CLU96_3778 [Chryseobacterium sp. 52]